MKLITGTDDDRSAHTMMVQEIRSHLHEGREFLVKHIRREQNLVSYFLANFGRIKKCTVMWLRSGPDEVRDLCNADLAADE